MDLKDMIPLPSIMHEAQLKHKKKVEEERIATSKLEIKEAFDSWRLHKCDRPSVIVKGFLPPLKVQDEIKALGYSIQKLIAGGYEIRW